MHCKHVLKQKTFSRQTELLLKIVQKSTCFICSDEDDNGDDIRYQQSQA
jgi:hypothetical protein